MPFTRKGNASVTGGGERRIHDREWNGMEYSDLRSLSM